MSARTAFIVGLLGCSLPVIAQNQTNTAYDPTEMAAAREALYQSHGAQITYLIAGERLEYQSNEGDPNVVWDGQGRIGGDVNKFWVKAEGEYSSDNDNFGEVELQALYSRAVHPFWDLQAGLRQGFKPDPSRTYGAIGLHGLAPYWFKLDGALFVSHKGDLSARVEATYDFRLTQRLLLQPRLELNAAFSDDSAIGVGSGLSTAEGGLRLRYEIAREFAPYIGLSWSRAYGDTADFRDASDIETISFVAGIRFWF